LSLIGKSGTAIETTILALDPPSKSGVIWRYAPRATPISLQRQGESFWYLFLPDHRSVYVSFNGYNKLGRHSKGLFRLIKEQNPEKLIIDMRMNGGGDYKEGLKHLIRPIRKLSSINQKGHLFILIGGRTFSAAMSNSAHFRYRTNATLVGSQIGEKPNSYQEARQMELPNSRWKVQYSVKFYKFVNEGENVIRPDKEIIPSWAEYEAGRDPVLEWALQK